MDCEQPAMKCDEGASRWFTAGCPIVMACFLLVSHARADEPVISSPAELWQGFDPAAEALEEEILKDWNEDGAHFQKLFFTAETVDGEKVRVFTIRGTPPESSRAAGTKCAGILHIHGGGQTASLDWVKFWTQRGYACVSFDFCGPWEKRTEFTQWGPLKHCNMATSEGGLQVTPTPRASSWYHWTIAARRALTLLAQDPAVDRDRLGIFGISMGGTLTWMVAGSDDRVRAAVPIYGCGYNHDRSKSVWGFGELSPNLSLWQAAVSSEAHAPYIRCPLLLLNATNDFHGWLDYCPAILQSSAGGDTGRLFAQLESPHSRQRRRRLTGVDGLRTAGWRRFSRRAYRKGGVSR